MEFLRLFLRHHFAGIPVAALQNVSCFPALVGWTYKWRKARGNGKRRWYKRNKRRIKIGREGVGCGERRLVKGRVSGCFRRINHGQGYLGYHYKLMKIFVFLPLFYSEYVKIIDGSGTTVLIRNGYSSTPQKPFAEVSFGNSENITVQIYLYSRYSTATLQFGILQQGLLSG